ncbi:MAG: LarC family nickel insertion protein [Spirochaetia bacterium]|nr:LarC family nickel insertion protein [Spirochaetia bacterium]
MNEKENLEKYKLFLNMQSGISGDMFTAAVLDLFDTAKTNAIFKNLKNKWEEKIIEFFLTNFNQRLKINISKVNRKGFAASYINYEYEKNDAHSHRKVADIVKMIEKSKLSGYEKETALKIIDYLAEAEAKVHGKNKEEIHLHEAGSEDSVLDMVSAAVLHELLGKPKIYANYALLSSSGSVNFSHGEISLPAPAVLEILKGFPVRFVEAGGEITTPTGASILKGLNVEFHNMSKEYEIIETGCGAGSKEFLDRPNILRTTLLKEFEYETKIN